MTSRTGEGRGRPGSRARPATPAVCPELPTGAALDGLRRALLWWYRVRRRDLPWRATRDPYAIWISEAMLQQTRVETVLAYYPRFMARFPDAASLAAASEADVLALWSGLGYYRRARSLRAAARVLVERHGGRFPRGREEVRALPGVGPYTAGAVLSIAYGLPEALVDGNVARVLARLFAHDEDPTTSSGQRWLWETAGHLLPARGAGDWNQALMELGATLCTPRRPRCADCPLATSCRARAQDRVQELPRARPRPANLEVRVRVLLVPRAGRWLLERRGAGERRMAGLFQFPTLELAPARGARCGLFEPHPPRAADGAELLEASGPILAELRHSITRHRVRVEVAPGRALWSGRRAPYRWASRTELEGLGLTGMARKILRRGLL